MSRQEGAQRGATLWFTGLSGSGKSTVAEHLLARLEERAVRALVLDGDDLREGLNADLGFSAVDRSENVRRVGEVALLFARSGHVVLVPVISPYAADRERVRRRHEDGAVPFLEIHVATPLEICEARDPKGLYKKARAGAIDQFTGVSDPYEIPVAPDIRLETDRTRPEVLADSLFLRLQADVLVGDLS